MSDHMPYELLVDILARLPVVSLLRFKSVCKSWYSLISNPSFVTKHLNHSKKNSDKILLGLYVGGADGCRYLLCRDNEQFGDEFSELELPLVASSRPPHEWFNIVGSANGIVCLQVGFCPAPRFILRNPSTRKSVTLPEPEAMRGLYVVGFGVHPTTHECKVVIIRHIRRYYYSKVDVYTQATGWRGSGSTYPSHCYVEHMSPQAFVNGAVNWLGRDPWVAVGCCKSILSFDMGAETFSVLALPTMLVNQKTDSLSIKVFEGSLALLCDRQRDDGSCCLWVMKEYRVAESWTKQFSFRLGVPVILERALGFRKHGEVLLSTRDNQCLSYDIRNKALTDTGIWRNASAFYVEPFVETLVSVENQNGLLDGGS